MTTDQRVAAIVVAYNGGQDLLACIDSLKAARLGDLEVIVVDNASTDDSIAAVQARYGASVSVIQRSTNGGYAAGANTGWRSTSAPIVLIANQDLTFADDCIERMRKVLLNAPREALVTPKIVLRTEPDTVNAVGNEVHLSGVSWCFGLGTAASNWSGTREVTAISGAVFMARRAFLHRLGGLDERYFMYMEDVDLSLRARQAGAVCLADCDALATHAWGLALTPQKFGLLERNRLALWRRFLGKEKGLWPVMLQAESMGWTYALLKGRPHLDAKWRALKAPLVLPASAGEQVSGWLARRHPYGVLFPASRGIEVSGALADAAVGAFTRLLQAMRRS